MREREEIKNQIKESLYKIEERREYLDRMRIEIARAEEEEADRG